MNNRTVCLMAVPLVFFAVALVRVPAGAASDMVEISVEITEINNTRARELGIRWFDTVQAGEIAKTMADQVPETLPDLPTLIDMSDWKRFTALTAELKILAEKGAAQILSKPKLVARSGSSAKFLVGGEFPVVAEGATSSSIEWKEYGIKTEMTPRILEDGQIDLTLKTEVSRLDWANRVRDFPAIATRMATSSVRVRSGQTIALAGLIETQHNDNTVGIPLLMDIPLLGHLFSRKSKVESKTNVLIFVTPRILE